jgi:hypothetical protein
MRYTFALLLVTGALIAAPPANPTFHKDVEPILQRSCQGCHRPGEIGPMPLLSYGQTRPWAKAIKNSVSTQKMPPWFADPTVGHFRNAMRLSKDEIATLAAWAETGAKQGDPKDAPAPVKFADGWRIGEPDHVVVMPTSFEVPAEGKVEYQYVIIPSGFTEDRWVQAIEARPGDRAINHHIIVFVRPKGSNWVASKKPGEIFEMDQVPEKERGGIMSAEWLHGFAPGTPPEVLPEGQAKLIPAGSDFVLQLHYTTNGKAGRDQSKIGMIFAKQAPRERVMTIPASTTKFEIPAGADNYPVDFSFTFQSNASLLGFFPHMHARGKAMTVRLKQPEEQAATDLLKMRWDFNWQLYYELADPIPLTRGSTVEATAVFDNSPNNPYNPDPTKNVKWGEQTWDEMAMAILNVAFDAKMDPGELLRPPKKPTPATSAGGLE